jgi:hypothetical protein
LTIKFAHRKLGSAHHFLRLDLLRCVNSSLDESTHLEDIYCWEFCLFDYQRA